MLPELYANPEFSWGPPAVEMTHNGELFQLYRKPDRSDRIDHSCLPVFDFISAMRESAEAEAEAPEKKKFEEVENTRRQQALDIEKKKNIAIRIRNPFNFQPNYNNGGKFNAKKTRNFRPMNSSGAPLPNTISIPSSAKVLAEFTIPQLSNLGEVVPLVEELGVYCLPCLYNKEVENISISNPLPLQEVNHHDDFYRRPDIFEDHVVQSLMHTEDTTIPLVIVSEDLLSLLLTAHRSVHPWHIKVAQAKNIFLLSHSNRGKGTRPDNAEKQWVGETALSDVAPSEGRAIASERISSLGDESTKVHESFIASCCSKTRATLGIRTKPNKFPYPTQPRLYRYRRFKMNANTPNAYNIVVRCEVDAVTKEGDFLRLFGLLEFERKEKENWKARILNGRGTSILPDAFQSNSAKMSRWIAQSLLSEASLMKIGLISRCPLSVASLNDKEIKTDPTKHQLLKVVSIPPANLLRQLNVNYNSMWATANMILSTVITNSKSPFGLIVKQNTRIVTLADTPNDVDDDDDDDDEEDEEDDDEESDEEDEDSGDDDA